MKTNKCAFKRSEILFVKDDDGHNYCIHESQGEDFHRWVELLGEYWEGDAQDVTVRQWLTDQGYHGEGFDSAMIGCDPNYYIETTEFAPECP